ncbi:MAG: FAD-dependent oxidoreductase, partial [Xanthomonadales bacterium]|nr:FAD-dependent oxidoreductase [Xanthomonadales bacterium]
DVKVIVRSPFEDMKASPWEKEDATHEGIPIIDNHVPTEFVLKDGKLAGMHFDRVKPVYDADGKRKLVSTGEDPVFYPCDDVLIAIGQENAFPWIEPGTGIRFTSWGTPIINDDETFQSTRKDVFFGGDAAFGPRNIITAVAHGHKAAMSIHLYCEGKDLEKRPPPHVN